VPHEFRMLGPLQVTADGRTLPLGGPKQRALLALLLVHANETVSRDRLIDELWGEAAPPTVGSELHVYLSRLRKLLAAGGAANTLTREAFGYRLQVEPAQLDTTRFRQLAGEGRHALGAGDAFAAAERLGEALALWRGPALADLQSERFAITAAARLEEERVVAVEQRLEAELALGRDQELVAELEALVAEHPYRERLRALLMRALYRCGRQAEALRVYQQARHTLAGELGLEPGQELKDLERAILTGDPALAGPPRGRLQPGPASEASPRADAALGREVRKVVTVLSSELSGSGESGERVDPERWRRVLSRCFEAMERVLVAHGGLVVEHSIGGALTAVFGLPNAHEDDALRAVRAAAELRERLPALADVTGLQLAFSAGIDSGEVLAGGAGTVAAGAAVNVAAHLQQAAAPGEILLGPETLRLLGTAVETELLAPLSVRETDPVEAYRFVRLSAPPTQQPTVFVGRERELTVLGEAFRRARDEQELHLVTLLGPAGIGKSRLAAEFVDSLSADAQVARGHCLSYGQELTYWPLVAALRELGEPAQPALERLVAGGATSPQQLAWTVQQALDQAARERPSLILLEDLQWAEPALLDLLDQVCELSHDAPILLLCVARPELLEQRPGWAGGKLNATSLLLEPLARSDCELLLAQAPTLARTQHERVLKLAGGNPLFLEELSAYLAEGGDERRLPPRIHALLQARLDLLSKPQRLLLGCAAVEGTLFHQGSLESLAPEELRDQIAAELAALTRTLLIRPGDAEFEAEQAFRFRHQLIRDTAYTALPKSHRAPLHERFAAWLHEQRGDRSELDDIVAYHLEQAALYQRELGTGDPALENRAANALTAAAERARWRPDMRAAASLCRRALALLAADDPRAPELQLQLSLAFSLLGEGDEARDQLEQAALHASDPWMIANVQLVGLQDAVLHGADVQEEVRRACADAIPLFEERGDHHGLGRAWHTLGLAESSELNVRAAAQAFANAAAAGKRGGDRSREARASGQALMELATNRLPAAAAVREFEQLVSGFPGEPLLEAVLAAHRAFAAYYAGRAAEARPLADEALDAVRRSGILVMAATLDAWMGWLEALNGDLERAERLALAGVEELRRYGRSILLCTALTMLAAIRSMQGRHTEALTLADEAAANGNDRRTRILVACARARAHAHLGAIEAARAAADEAVAEASTTDALAMHAQAQHALAETLAAADELPAAHAAAVEAARLYTGLERTVLAQQAAALAAQMDHSAASSGRPTTAA
jgi:DNA-binding SARP family transcriptional activator/class 3 adenylate cyclase